MSIKHSGITAALLAAGMLAGSGVQAATTTVMASFSGNDCAGYFGDSFDACQIFINDNDERIEISPVIAKWDVDDEEWETNSIYPIDGSEFSTGGNGSTGTWTYTPDAEDPFVRYWAVKAGNSDPGGFNLFWKVDTGFITNGTCFDPGTGSQNYTLACLNAAQTVTSGDWTTPGDKDLSHITFYDSDDPKFPPVPVPAAVWLFGSGLLGLVGIARRKKAA